MLGKKPLIYIPSKKKKAQVSGSTPSPTPEALGGVYTYTFGTTYNCVSGNLFRPCLFSYYPDSSPFYFNGKRMWSIHDGMSGATIVVPIKPDTSSQTLAQKNALMEWYPLPNGSPTANPTLSCGHAFYIGSVASSDPSLQNNNIYRIKTNYSVSSPYYTNVSIKGASTITVPNSGTWRLNHLECFATGNTMATLLGKIETAIQSVGLPGGSYGCLFFTSNEFGSTGGLWTDSQLLDFNQYYLGNYFGAKTTVTDLTISL